MNGRRVFVKGILSMSIASIFWQVQAKDEVDKLVEGLKSIEEILLKQFAVKPSYLKEIVPEVLLQLEEEEKKVLTSIVSKYRRDNSIIHLPKQADMVIKKVMKAVYTGKYINGADARYDLSGGYCRQLLPHIYKPRLTCSGETNHWGSI